MNVNGHVAILARSGTPLTLNDTDHMITNAVSLIGSRGHLGGPFTNILSLLNNGRIPLVEVVTDAPSGPEILRDLLKSPERIIEKNCKFLARLDGASISA